MSEPPDARLLQIGALAQASGVTVRTLRHYESIGLLVPARRSSSGYRLYGDRDIERLYRIRALSRLGLSLDTIGRTLDGATVELHDVLDAQLADVEQRLANLQRQRRALLTVRGSSDADDLIPLLEAMAEPSAAVENNVSIVVYEDLEAAFTYLIDVFGLGPGALTRDSDARIVHGELQAGNATVWLHRESSEFALASPRSVGVATAMMAVIVDDVDAHHQRTVDRGGAVAYPPVDQPYGFREYGARDSEGGLWCFMRRSDDGRPPIESLPA